MLDRRIALRGDREDGLLQPGAGVEAGRHQPDARPRRTRWQQRLQAAPGGLGRRGEGPGQFAEARPDRPGEHRLTRRAQAAEQRRRRRRIAGGQRVIAGVEGGGRVDRQRPVRGGEGDRGAAGAMRRQMRHPRQALPHAKAGPRQRLGQRSGAARLDGRTQAAQQVVPPGFLGEAREFDHIGLRRGARGDAGGRDHVLEQRLVGAALQATAETRQAAGEQQPDRRAVRPAAPAPPQHRGRFRRRPGHVQLRRHGDAGRRKGGIVAAGECRLRQRGGGGRPVQPRVQQGGAQAQRRIIPGVVDRRAGERDGSLGVARRRAASAAASRSAASDGCAMRAAIPPLAPLRATPPRARCAPRSPPAPAPPARRPGRGNRRCCPPA